MTKITYTINCNNCGSTEVDLKDNILSCKRCGVKAKLTKILEDEQ